MPKHEMSKDDASRIQSTQSRGGGDMSSKGFAARAQSAGDRNANANFGGGNTQSGNTGSNTGSQGSKK